MQRFIYADNAATTPVADYVLEAMLPYFKGEYGNASTIYSVGRAAKKAVDEAREKTARALGCDPSEIYFTSCGTESDNWAIKGVANRLKKRGKNRVVTTNFEHHAVLHSCQALERAGFEVAYLPVNENGLITAKQVEDAVDDTTALVTIIYANNEIGTIQPIAEIGAVCKAKGVYFHTDAVQAVGNLKISVREQNIDLLSLSGHKINAPKGVGALYVRKGVIIDSFMDGGAQERGKRAGTENVPYIVGLGAAIEYAAANIDKKNAYLSSLRDRALAGLTKIPRSRVNGDMTHRLSGNLNMSFEGIEGESLLLWLDMFGIGAASGSACTSGSLDPSHVLLAIGLPHEIAHGSLRLSFGMTNTVEDVDYIVEKVTETVTKLRAMSPVWETIEKGE